jgi:hypothetical protein
MIRTALLISAMLILSAGCGGEPERSRFIPASGDEKPTSPTDRKASREVKIPKNIEMH